MIPVKPRIIVTFDSTVYAMEAEKACRDRRVQGRLISVPGEISAGCGLCFMAPPDEKEQLMRLARENVIHMDKMYELEW